MRQKASLLFLLLGIGSWGYHRAALSPTSIPSFFPSHALVRDTLTATIFFQSDTLGEPIRLAIFDSLLLVGDASLRPALHIISLTGQYLAGLGRRGEGPGEFLNIWKIFSTAPTGIWIWDGRLRRLTQLNLAIRPPRLERQKRITASFDLFSFDWIDEARIISAGFQPDGRLVLMDSTFQTLRVLGPDPPGDAPMAVRQHAYQRWVCYDATTRYAIVAYYYADLIEAYRLDGSLAWAVRGADGFDPIYDIRSYQGAPARATRPDTRYGYKDLSCFIHRDTNTSYAIMLFSGYRANQPEAWMGRALHVVNLSTGQLVARFALSLPSYSGLAIDSDYCVYTIATLPQPAIVRYCLPKNIFF